MITRARTWLAEQADGGRRGTTLVVLVLLGMLLGWIVWGRTQAEGEAELARDNAAHIAEEVRQACDQGGEVARELGDLCRQAEEIADEPAVELVPPSDEQLRPLVQQYVAEWLVANPPRDGRDGITPSVETISRLIAAELAENPPQDGEDGEDGRPPTAAELQPIVATAVEAFLEANPPPAGEDGEDGERGPAGPTCPEGTTLRERQVLGPPPETWFVCVEDEDEEQG